jgi:hypothetical protein
VLGDKFRQIVLSNRQVKEKTLDSIL